MRSFRHPRWQHLDYRVKVATTQENKPPTQGTRQWTFTTLRWRCGSILLPSLNAGVPEPIGGTLCRDITLTVWYLISSVTQLLFQQFATNKENFKSPHNWAFVRESTWDLWIPLTMDQQCRKCFHAMTRSCLNWLQPQIKKKKKKITATDEGL